MRERTFRLITKTGNEFYLYTLDQNTNNLVLQFKNPDYFLNPKLNPNHRVFKFQLYSGHKEKTLLFNKLLVHQ